MPISIQVEYSNKEHKLGNIAAFSQIHLILQNVFVQKLGRDSIQVKLQIITIVLLFSLGNVNFRSNKIHVPRKKIHRQYKLLIHITLESLYSYCSVMWNPSWAERRSNEKGYLISQIILLNSIKIHTSLFNLFKYFKIHTNKCKLSVQNVLCMPKFFTVMER